MVIDSPLPGSFQPLIDGLLAAGGRPVLVGGMVRDHLLGLQGKDVDIEVFGLSMERLIPILSAFGDVHSVGKSFGVLKLRLDGHEIDVSLPRRERKTGLGHRGFEVDYDPNMSYEEASSRRDFTINSIGLDLTTGETLDPWGGCEDLRLGVIRHISGAFDEDPLRVLRACQFAARFEFGIAPETVARCQALQEELPTLSTERIWGEFRKLLLKARRPSLGIQALDQTGALALFPELSALHGVQQNPAYHPEGDVWIHNNLVLDACAGICRSEGLDETERLIVSLAALCHDLGKPATTRLEEGIWRAKGHEEAGEEPTRCFLRRIGCPGSWQPDIIALVLQHTRPLRLWDQHQRDPVSDAAIRRLAVKVSVYRLCLVSLADFRGRTTVDAAGVCQAVDWLRQRAEALSVVHSAPMPVLQGRDLQALGVAAGPQMGKLLKLAYEAQLDGEFDGHSDGVNWLRQNLSLFS